MYNLSYVRICSFSFSVVVSSLTSVHLLLLLGLFLHPYFVFQISIYEYGKTWVGVELIAIFWVDSPPLLPGTTGFHSPQNICERSCIVVLTTTEKQSHIDQSLMLEDLLIFLIWTHWTSTVHVQSVSVDINETGLIYINFLGRVGRYPNSEIVYSISLPPCFFPPSVAVLNVFASLSAPSLSAGATGEAAGQLNSRPLSWLYVLNFLSYSCFFFRPTASERRLVLVWWHMISESAFLILWSVTMATAFNPRGRK